MEKRGPNKDQNAKNKDWQVPNNLPETTPQAYPDRRVPAPKNERNKRREE